MIEDALMKELKSSFIARELTFLKEQGMLKDFIEYAREQAKKDGMDTDGLMTFLDEMEKLADDEDDDDGINWFKFQVAIAEVCPFKSQIFKGDKSFIVESEVLSARQCAEYVEYDKAPIHLETYNEAIKDLGLKLEFVEALNNPFDLDGFQNFVRFKVIKIEE